MSEQDRDSFWDIEKLVPRKNDGRMKSFSTKEKLVDVDVPTLDSVEDSEQYKLTEQRAEDGDEIIYTPESGLIKRVCIRRIKEKYDFHANFVKAAELYFDFKAQKCDFVPFFSYMPQYTQLTQAQKNYYFYWRSEARLGRFVRTDNSYFYLYVYEIINLPHLVPPEEGLDMLITLWREYRTQLSGIDQNMALWVQDYCLIHRLDCPMDKIRDFVFGAVGASGLKEFYLSDAETMSPRGTASVLAYLSDYDWRSGKYADGENKEPYERHLTGAMSLIVSELLLGGLISDEGSTARLERTAFRSALTTSAVKYRITVDYRPIAEQTDLRAVVTAAIKYTENRLRALMGVKSRLSVKGLPDKYKSVIDSYFEVYFDRVNRERARAARPEYEKNYEVEREELSFADADEIERASWTTTARLVEDSEEYRENEAQAAPTQVEEPTEKAACGADAFGLDSQHIAFISAALDEDYAALADIVAKASALTDSFADEINEAFADGFGDVILEPDGEGYRIIDDYKEDITEWLLKIRK